MSPLPWPLFGRTGPYAGVTGPPVRLHEEPAVRVVDPREAARARIAAVSEALPLGPGTERAEHAHLHPWLAGEDAVMARLAALTDRYGPWVAALRLFSGPDTPQGTQK